MNELYDMHCHLDFASNCTDVAEDAIGRIKAIDSTVSPSSFVSAREMLAPYPEIQVGLGMHPWWVADGRLGEADFFRFENLVKETSILGEIGLDFHGKRKATRTHQMEVFARALSAICVAGDKKLVFLHAVKSYSDIFGLLEHYGTPRHNTCVFHWFQGSQDDFKRAISEGFMFSVGMKMLTTPKGKLFAKEIPDKLLLIETDSPPHEEMPWSADAWEQEIRNAARCLAELRDASEQDTLEIVAANSSALLQKYGATSA